MVGSSMARIALTLMTSVVTLASLCVLTCHGFHDDPVLHRSRRGGSSDGWAPALDGHPATHTKHDLHSAHTVFKPRSTRASTSASSSSHKIVKSAYTLPSNRRGKRYSEPAASNPQDVAKNEEEVEQVVVDIADDGVRYGVLLDAGSSSTKAKVYTYTPGALPSLVPHVQLEFSERVKPGLGRFMHSLGDLGEYLLKTLSYAADVIPERLHASTPVYLMATAGLRTLPIPKAKALLRTARQLMRNLTINPFLFKDDHVSILSGEEEAVYAWLAVNYLNGFFSTNMTRRDSVGVLELGGGSMQVAFSPDGPLYQEEFQIYVGPRRFDLYAQSYLNYGSAFVTNHVRWRLLQDEQQFLDGKNLLSPCMLSGDTDTYHQANVTLTVVGTGDAARCEEVLAKILEPADAVHCSPRPCAIGDRFQPPVGSLPFYAFSAFLYAPKGLDAVEADDTLNITKLRQNAWKYCGLTVPEAVNLTGTRPQFASNDCLMGLYIPILLTRSMGFDEHTNTITVTKYINGKRIDWALGAMIQQLSMSFMDDIEQTIKCRQGEKPFPLVRGTRVIASTDQSGSRPLTMTLTHLPVLLLAWLSWRFS